MRILYVCHRFPYPPKRGGTIRPFNMIRHLAQSHEVVVCSLTRSAQATRDAQGIAPFCAEFHIGQVDDRFQTMRMIATLPTPFPASASFFHSSSLNRHIRRLLVHHLAHMEHGEVMPGLLSSLTDGFEVRGLIDANLAGNDRSHGSPVNRAGLTRS